jgi:hypothetical protein
LQTGSAQGFSLGGQVFTGPGSQVPAAVQVPLSVQGLPSSQETPSVTSTTQKPPAPHTAAKHSSTGTSVHWVSSWHWTQLFFSVPTQAPVAVQVSFSVQGLLSLHALPSWGTLVHWPLVQTAFWHSSVGCGQSLAVWHWPSARLHVPFTQVSFS